ncbi:hypothetical protein PUN28_001888 [Cardiocondyla obscurior]|uniref:Uncharacterized protein n=1 Tax=Cardiocondyla obscurior TaxID=286306 RepID=A0AAW2GRS5_9HYME
MGESFFSPVVSGTRSSPQSSSIGSSSRDAFRREVHRTASRTDGALQLQKNFLPRSIEERCRVYTGENIPKEHSLTFLFPLVIKMHLFVFTLRKKVHSRKRNAPCYY